MQRNKDNRKSGGGKKPVWSRTNPEGLRKDQTPKSTRKLITTQNPQTPLQVTPHVEEDQVDQSKISSRSSSKSSSDSVSKISQHSSSSSAKEIRLMREEQLLMMKMMEVRMNSCAR